MAGWWHNDFLRDGRFVRYLTAILLVTLCSGCALTPHAVERATAAQNRAVVFDIDGTLTRKVGAIRTAREGAAEAVRAYADAGYRVVYLSARTPLFQWYILVWMETHSFPEGRIHVTESPEDRRDHSAFKLRVLEEYGSQGWTFVAAYGDSSTDFEAYANAGIARDRIFALRREGEDACEPGPWYGCYESWPEQADTIAGLLGSGH